jgi:hypothetical protein
MTSATGRQELDKQHTDFWASEIAKTVQMFAKQDNARINVHLPKKLARIVKVLWMKKCQIENIVWRARVEKIIRKSSRIFSL